MKKYGIYEQILGMAAVDLKSSAGSFSCAPKPAKRGCGAAGRAMVGVAVETPPINLRFATIRLVSGVSSEEIQPLVRGRPATEAVIRTDGWQGYSFLDASPGLHNEWLGLVRGRNIAQGTSLDRQY